MPIYKIELLNQSHSVDHNDLFEQPKYCIKMTLYWLFDLENYLGIILGIIW